MLVRIRSDTWFHPGLQEVVEALHFMSSLATFNAVVLVPSWWKPQPFCWKANVIPKSTCYPLKYCNAHTTMSGAIGWLLKTFVRNTALTYQSYFTPEQLVRDKKSKIQRVWSCCETSQFHKSSACLGMRRPRKTNTIGSLETEEPLGSH